MLNDLFELLIDEDFQDPRSGLLNFPAYIYTYPPEQEYRLRESLKRLQKRLNRPPHHQECLLLNIYEVFGEYLQNKTLGGRPIFDRMLEREQKEPDKVRKQIYRHIDSDAFLDEVADTMKKFATGENAENRSYVFVHGIGSIHPFLTASRLLDHLENHIQGYKVILFYPGTYENKQYRMFGILNRKNIYRGSCLNEILE